MNDKKYLRALRGQLEKVAVVDAEDILTGGKAAGIAALLGAGKAALVNRAHRKQSVWTKPISTIFSKKIVSKRRMAGRAAVAGALLGVGYSKARKYLRGQR